MQKNENANLCCFDRVISKAPFPHKHTRTLGDNRFEKSDLIFFKFYLTFISILKQNSVRTDCSLLSTCALVKKHLLQ